MLYKILSTLILILQGSQGKTLLEYVCLAMLRAGGSQPLLVGRKPELKGPDAHTPHLTLSLSLLSTARSEDSYRGPVPCGSLCND